MCVRVFGGFVLVGLGCFCVCDMVVWGCVVVLYVFCFCVCFFVWGGW